MEEEKNWKKRKESEGVTISRRRNWEKKLEEEKEIWKKNRKLKEEEIERGMEMEEEEIGCSNNFKLEQEKEEIGKNWKLELEFGRKGNWKKKKGLEEKEIGKDPFERRIVSFSRIV